MIRRIGVVAMVVLLTPSITLAAEKDETAKVLEKYKPVVDKGLKWRHGATRHLDTMLLLAPSPDWVKTLPNAKLPDRQDFPHYGNDLAGRVKAWTRAVSASQQLVDEFATWLEKPDMGQVLPI